MMKIAVQTANILDRLGVDEGFEAIRAAGFDGVDLNADHFLPKTDIRAGKSESVFSLPMSDFLAMLSPYKRAAARTGVAISQIHAPFPSFVKENAAMNEYLKMALEKCVAACAYLDCPYIVIHPVFLPYDDALDPEEEHRQNILLYSGLIDALKQYNVIACLENMFVRHRGKIYAACCGDAAEAAEYIDELNAMAGETRFAFCLDTGHALLAGKEITRMLTVLGDRVRTLHIHDNNGVDDQHLAPYMGVMDWQRFTRGLRAIGYRGVLSFETFHVLDVVDPMLMQDILAFIAKTGRLFASRVSGEID